MIIPPDSEKDATLFSPTSSTPSLLPPPSESDIDPPPRAHTRNPAFGYPFGSSQDDLGLGYTHNGDPLPPYHRDEGDGIDAPHMRERSRRSVTRPHVVIPATSSPRLSTDDELTPRASASTSRLPFTTDTPLSSTAASTSKLWEGSSSSSLRKRKERIFPNVTPGWKRWWKRWRRWIYVAIGLLLAGIGLMIGLLVGVDRGVDEASTGVGKPWKDITGDGKRQTNWISTGESLNLTYVASRVRCNGL